MTKSTPPDHLVVLTADVDNGKMYSVCRLKRIKGRWYTQISNRQVYYEPTHFIGLDEYQAYANKDSQMTQQTVQSQPIGSIPVKEVFDYMREILTLNGYCPKFCIAGGAVRDEINGYTPRDYDVFVMRTPLPDPPQGMIDYLKNRLIQARAYEKIQGLHGWHPTYVGVGPLAVFKYKEAVVQVMYHEVDTINDLLASFDWNICQFAYDGETIITPPGPFFTVQTPLLRVKIVNPILSFIRGMNFTRRYGVKISDADYHQLVKECLIQLHKPQESSNEPTIHPN